MSPRLTSALTLVAVFLLCAGLVWVALTALQVLFGGIDWTAIVALIVAVAIYAVAVE